MLGALAVAAWFVISADRPAQKTKSEEQTDTQTSGPGFSGDGKANTSTGGQGGSGASGSGTSGHGGDDIPDPLPGLESKQNQRELRSVQVIHLHLPDDAGSRELSESLAEIRMSWPDHLTISTINVSSNPKILAEWRVSKAPAVVFQTSGQRLYTMEELWPKPRLAKKIEQLIHGLVEVDKNWRPEIKGMERR